MHKPEQKSNANGNGSAAATATAAAVPAAAPLYVAPLPSKLPPTAPATPSAAAPAQLQGNGHGSHTQQQPTAGSGQAVNKSLKSLTANEANAVQETLQKVKPAAKRRRSTATGVFEGPKRNGRRQEAVFPHARPWSCRSARSSRSSPRAGASAPRRCRPCAGR